MKNRQLTFAAFSLIEVALSLGVAAFCLIAVLALLPVGLQTHRDAIAQTASAGIVSAVATDLRSTPSTLTQSAQFQISFSGSQTLYFDADGRLTQPPGIYRLTINFLSPPSGAGATSAILTITWPGSANPNNAAGFVQTFVAINRS